MEKSKLNLKKLKKFLKLNFFIIIGLLFTACAKFDFDTSSLSSSIGGVTVLGITGGADITADTFLFDGNIPTVTWVDEPDETNYDVLIYENDGVTLRCEVRNLPQDTVLHTFTSCPLAEGQAYFVVVEKIIPYSVTAAKNTLSTSLASKVKRSVSSAFASQSKAFSAFEFLYPATLSVNSNSALEDSGNGMVVASLSVPSEWPVTFSWTTNDGTAVNSGIFKDYDTVNPNTVTFTPGQTTKNLSVPITDDPRDEFNQDLSVVLSSQTNVKTGLSASQVAALTIIDNDPPPDLELTSTTINEGETTTTLTLSLSEISEKPISFSYGTQDGTARSADGDYAVINPTSTTFNPGDTTVSFAIESLEDGAVCEFDETVGVAITSSTNLGSGPLNSVIIADNDLPRLTLTGDSQLEGTPLTFTANLSDPCPTKTVSFDWHTVPVTATNGLDFTEQSGTTTFAPNITSQNMSVTTINDTTRETENKYFAIGARNRINLADSPAAAVGEIRDDETGVASVKVVTVGPRSCALSSDGQIKCWGQNEYIGGSQSAHLGDEPNEMGDSLPAYDFGTWDDDNNGATAEVPLEVTQVQHDQRSMYVHLNNQRVKGVGHVLQNKYGDDLNEMGNNLPFLDFGTWDHDNNTGTAAVQHKIKSLQLPCVILDNDRIKCWGSGFNGALGYGSNDWINYDYQMGNALPYVDLGTWDHDNNAVTPQVQHKVLELSTSCALLDNYQVKCWGNNSVGQLGLGDFNNRGDEPLEMGNALPYINLGSGRTVKSISGDSRLRCVILDNDDLKCWGLNSSGQLGQGHTTDIGGLPGQMGDNLPPVNLGTWDHDANAMTPEINLLAKKVTTSEHLACVILINDRVKCFGSANFYANGYGTQYGHLPTRVGNFVPYVNLGTGRTAKDILSSGYNTYVLRDDDSLVGYGQNKYGELGYGDQISRTNVSYMGNNLQPIDLGTGLIAQSSGLSSGGRRMCAVLNNGSLKCWGYTTYDGVMVDTPSRHKIGDSLAEMGAALPKIQLPAGRTAVNLFMGKSIYTEGVEAGFCAILNGAAHNEFVCWGSHERVNNTSQWNNHGDRPNTMGNNLSVYRLPNNKKVISVQSGHRSTCSLDLDLDLHCWGDAQVGLAGFNGILGYDPTNDARIALVGTNRKVLKYSPGFGFGCALLDDYTVKCWGRRPEAIGYESSISRGGSAATSGDNLPAVNLGNISYPVEVSTGYATSCARFANGRTKCWGSGSGDYANGAMGYGDTLNRGGSPGTMGNTLPFIDLGTGQTALQIFHNSYSRDSVCARRQDHSIVCWGTNNDGQFGNERPSSNIGDGPGEMGNNLVPLMLDGIPTSIEASSNHNCTVLTDNRVKCWGENQWGELGQGHVDDVGNQVNQMGVNLPDVNIVW